MIPLNCPDCSTLLPTGTESLTCTRCGRVYPILNGIPRFVPEDPFYLNEDRWSRPDESTGGLRNRLVRKQRFFVERLKNRPGRLLDLGCGGGWRLFAQGRQVAGVDVAQRSLEAARTIYDTAVAADWTRLPFPDSTFDLAVSSDVLGHVPMTDKDAVFREIYRVLKPGGRTLHYIEAEGADPLTRYARRRPDLYQKHFVDPEGHIGMERPSAIFARFRRAGFRPVREQGAYKLLVYVNRTLQLYDNEHARALLPLRIWTGAARIAMRSSVTESLGNLLIAGGLEIGDRILPRDWASGALVEYRKPRRK